MKKKLFLLCCFCVSIVYSQPKNKQKSQTKISFDLALKMQNHSFQTHDVAVLIKGNIEHIKQVVKNNGGHFKFSAGDIASVSIPVSALQNLVSDQNIFRIEQGSKKIQALNDSMLVNNNIIKVHDGVSPLPQGYDGSGVVMGFIDSGVDYTHPDFKDSLGNTRVKFIWDHLMPNAANTPQPYNYGQEFTEADINAELQGGPVTGHVDAIAHGTHVTGIGASNGSAVNNFKGVAPKADIIAVAINFNLYDDQFLSTIADAVAYIYEKADQLGKPCVINISAGTYFGSHDGKDLSAQLIDNLITAQNGRSLVCAAGNIGGYPFHVQTNCVATDTSFTWNTGDYFELWADTAGFNNVQFSVGADQTTPVYDFRGALSYRDISAHLNILRNDTVFNSNGDRLGIIMSYAELIGDSYLLQFLITEDSAYNWRFSTTGNGSFDAYSWAWIAQNGIPPDTIYPAMAKYVLPDVYQGICSSFQCSDKVITVGQYVNRNSYIDVNGNPVTFPTVVGSLASSSSWGPTRDGRLKPDITATGEVTLSALKLSSAAWFIANQPYKVAQGGMHIRDGGTSSASPVVAGIAALYLQKNPTASWQDIKDHLVDCAKQDTFTGTILPNNSWGNGKVDAFRTMIGCTAVISEEREPESKLHCYPNPFSQSTTIYLAERKGEAKLIITDAMGKTIKQFIIPKGQKEFHLQNLHLAKGVYFYSINENESIVTKKMIAM